ncbi:hypothetical protein TPSD3_16795 [Thioflexithrix psekupsensis]|uniref:Uncharacterized protein n=1 Tax=Thioflexithrix psekupsensis TaxID=1570016 RepID=A0A251X4R9_9GAMM|nr:hypothetical protein TPSD3_16795 [Thioflexithrix psekupsensis]
MQRYPNGSYRISAEELVLTAKIKQQTTDYRSALSRIKQEATTFANEAEKLNQSLAELNDLSGKFPLVSDAELRAEFEKLRNQMSEQYMKLVSQKSLQEFLVSYNNAMNGGNLTVAAQVLGQRKDDTDAELVALIKDFPQRSLSILKNQVNQELAKDQFNNANNILSAYQNIPVSLRQGTDAELEKLKLEVDKRQDQHLYENAKPNPTLSNLDSYLKEAPLKAMQREVNAYREYLSKIDPNAVIPNLQLQITRIEWQGAKEGDNVLAVRMYGQAEVTKDVSSENNVNTTLPMQTFSAASNKKLEISITVTYKGWFSTPNNGSATFETTPVELASGKKVDLRNTEGTLTASVYFGLTGYPQAPVLPDWKYQ